MSTQPPQTDTRPAVLSVPEGLAPTIALNREEMERERRLPAALARAMADTGMFRLAVPRRFGGDEADAASLVGVIEELSAIDGSVGLSRGSATTEPQPGASFSFLRAIARLL